MMNLRHLSIAVLAPLSLFPSALAAQDKSAAAAEVRKTIEDHYFKAQATGDGSHLKGTFIDEGRMMWIADGQLRTRTSGEYIAMFKGQPAADAPQPMRQVVMVDVTGDAAVAKAELDLPDSRTTDYFSLLKVGNEWKIVHKWFHRAMKNKPAQF